MTLKNNSKSEKAEVDQWFANLKHPQKKTLLAVRQAILESDARMSECIKWKTPTFMYKGNLASLQPNAKRFASLMFHRGAEIPGDHPLLLGNSRLVRTMKFNDVEDVQHKAADLTTVVKAWCAWQEEYGT